MASSSSSLVELKTREDFLKCTEEMEKHLPYSLMMHSTLKVHMSERLFPELKNVRKTFYRMKDSWDSCILWMEVKDWARYCCFFTADRNDERFTEAIDWNSNVFMYFGIDGGRVGTAQNATKKFPGFQMSQPSPCYTFMMTVEQAKNLQISPPPDVEIRPLQLEDADIVNDTWKFRCSGSLEYVRELVRGGITRGVYVDGKVVSWVVTTFHGFIGMLYTLPEYRGRGYAGLVVHSIAKALAEEGLVPFATIELENNASKALFEKLKFFVTGSTTVWIDCMSGDATGYIPA